MTDTVKTRSLKRRSGRIGSLARRSWTTNAKAMTMPIVKSPMIWGEPQAYSWPPHADASSNDVTLMVSKSAPSRSIAWCLIVFGM